MNEGALSLYNVVVSDWISNKKRSSVSCYYHGRTILLRVLQYELHSNDNKCAVVIKRLLDEGAHVEHREACNDYSPLCVAVTNGLIECVRLLISRSAVVTWCETTLRRWPLLSETREHSMIHMLIDAGSAKGIPKDFLNSDDLSCIKNRRRCSDAAVALFVWCYKIRGDPKDVAGLLLKFVWDTRTSVLWCKKKIETETKKNRMQ